MYISDDATPDEVREMATERRALAAQDRALRAAWLSDPRILMAQAVRSDGTYQAVPVPRVAAAGRVSETERATGQLQAGLFAVSFALNGGMGLAGLLPWWLWVPAALLCAIQVAAGLRRVRRAG